MLTDDEQRADIEFLVDRATETGRISFGGATGRWTGRSSNALVAVAYGRKASQLPADPSDLAACYRCLSRMPAHRRFTPAVVALLGQGEAAVEGRFPGGIGRAREAVGWQSPFAGQEAPAC